MNKKLFCKHKKKRNMKNKHIVYKKKNPNMKVINNHNIKF